jgi:hypothetical protein
MSVHRDVVAHSRQQRSFDMEPKLKLKVSKATDNKLKLKLYVFPETLNKLKLTLNVFEATVNELKLTLHVFAETVNELKLTLNAEKAKLHVGLVKQRRCRSHHGLRQKITRSQSQRTMAGGRRHPQYLSHPEVRLGSMRILKTSMGLTGLR